MTTTTFENARIGDRVWSMRRGWGTVRKIDRDTLYPLKVTYQHVGIGSYTLDGLAHVEDITQSLFWDEVVVKAPIKPVPALDVDTKVLVWTDPSVKQRRHFSHFGKDGRIWVFDSGRTSYTKLHRDSITAWPNWELTE